MAKHGNDMIWAVSMNAKRPRKKPVKVARKLIGTAAWKNHAMKEVPDPAIKVKPITPLNAPDPAMLSELEKLRKEKAELEAKLAAKPKAEPVATRGPGRPSNAEKEAAAKAKDQTQA